MQLAARDGQRPHVVVAAERIAAVRRERDARAVVRPDRLAIVERSPGQLVLIRSVGRDRPDVVAAVAVGEERDPFAVGRPRGLPRVVEHIGDACRGAARGRQRPDAALHVDGERAAVGRDADRHRRPFVNGDLDRRRRGRERAVECRDESQHADRNSSDDHDGLPEWIAAYCIRPARWWPIH